MIYLSNLFELEIKKDYTYLDQLTDKTKQYKVKVKVIQKARPKQSPGKKKCQQLILQDDKGNTMRGAIFGDDISTFEQALERNGEYEISNAMIQPVPQQFQLKDNEYQMNFNDRVNVTPLHGESSTHGPKFLSIAEIPRNDDTNKELLDVLGIVLYVGEIRSVRTGNKEVPVRDIIITDDSTQHPLIMCAWNDLAEMDCETFANWSKSFIITALTAVHVATYKGFSLASTMSTEIVSDPQGERAAKLRLWAEENQMLLRDRQAMILEARTPLKARIISTLAEINAKKAANTWQEQTHWIKITIPEANHCDLYFYMGCNNCGRKGIAEKGDTYTCSHCKDNKAIAIPRVTFTFIAVDKTGTKKFTIFTKEVETLFGLTSSELHSVATSDGATKLDEKINHIRSTELFLEIGPSVALNSSRLLSWVVRTISFE
ncbi:Replication protein A 70 kDa DNA-binding subunit B [Bienertia sinuspersici]